MIFLDLDVFSEWWWLTSAPKIGEKVFNDVFICRMCSLTLIIFASISSSSFLNDLGSECFLLLFKSMIEYGDISKNVSLQAGYGLRRSINFWYVFMIESTMSLLAESITNLPSSSVRSLVPSLICKSSQWPLCYHNRIYKCILTTLYKKTFVNHLSDHCVTITGYTNVYWQPYIRNHL